MFDFRPEGQFSEWSYGWHNEAGVLVWRCPPSEAQQVLCLLYREWKLVYEHCGGLPVSTFMIDCARAMGYDVH